MCSQKGKNFVSTSFSNRVIDGGYGIRLWLIWLLRGHHLWLGRLMILDGLIAVCNRMRILWLLSHHHCISWHVVTIRHYCIVVNKLVRTQPVIHWLLLLWKISVLLLWNRCLLIISPSYMIFCWWYWSTIISIVNIIIITLVLHCLSLLPSVSIVDCLTFTISHAPLPKL